MSYMTSHDKSKMNTMIGISETLGSLFAGPALAWLFALGMKFKGVWFGLSYFGLAAWCGLCLLGLFILEPTQDQELMDIDETQPSMRSDTD